MRAFQSEDYARLASLADPERGVTFTPNSTVDVERDRTLSREDISRIAKETTASSWGSLDGSGGPIQMTATQYISTYVMDADYTRAPEIGIDRIIMSGNALDNINQSYSGCRFVDFTYPGSDTDWTSLRLVFSPAQTGWYLVGVVHGQWTP